MTPKPGYTTTEFWLTLLNQLAAFAAIVHPGFHVPVDVQAVAGAAGLVGTAVYTWQRSRVKQAALAWDVAGTPAKAPAKK